MELILFGHCFLIRPKSFLSTALLTFPMFSLSAIAAVRQGKGQRPGQARGQLGAGLSVRDQSLAPLPPAMGKLIPLWPQLSGRFDIVSPIARLLVLPTAVERENTSSKLVSWSATGKVVVTDAVFEGS